MIDLRSSREAFEELVLDPIAYYVPLIPLRLDDLLKFPDEIKCPVFRLLGWHEATGEMQWCGCAPDQDLG